MPDTVKVHLEDRLATVTIDRPPVNALNSDLLRDLARVFAGLTCHADVGAIVLTGAGEKAFVAGADIAEMAGKSGLEMRRFSERSRATRWGAGASSPSRATCGSHRTARRSASPR